MSFERSKALEMVRALRESDFAYNVDALGRDWDVYWVIYDGQPGTLFLRMPSPEEFECGWLPGRAATPEGTAQRIEWSLTRFGER